MNNSVQKGSDQKYCTECAAVISVKAELCPKCGVRQSSAGGYLGVVTANDKSRITAALLAIFLGSFGVHRFYLGNLGLGLLYLLFFWTLIPGIVAFIEFIIFLTMSDQKFAQKYGTVR